MKISTSLLLSASFFCLVSCSEKTAETNSETATATDLETSAAANTTAPTATDLGASPEASANGAASPTVIEMPATANAGAATAPGMNPPHGQPGHNCAIAVGAPLDGSGAKPASPQIISAPQPGQPAPSQNAQAPSTVTTTTAPGMNPPHGQPGHDCAIAVGAPLKK